MMELCRSAEGRAASASLALSEPRAAAVSVEAGGAVALPCTAWHCLPLPPPCSYDGLPRRPASTLRAGGVVPGSTVQSMSWPPTGLRLLRGQSVKGEGAGCGRFGDTSRSLPRADRTWLTLRRGAGGRPTFVRRPADVNSPRLYMDTCAVPVAGVVDVTVCWTRGSGAGSNSGGSGSLLSIFSWPVHGRLFTRTSTA